MCEEGVVDRRGRVGDREGGGRRLHACKGVGVGRGRAGEWRPPGMRRPPGRRERQSSVAGAAAREATRASGSGGSSAPARMSGSGGGFARASARASVSERVRVEC
jgi:hypothetical protein